MLTGRVQFGVESGQCEAFLNRCAAAGLPVERIKATEGGFVAWTPARCYAKMRPVAKKTGSRMRLRRKRGLWFTLRHFRGRWGLAVGPLALLAVLGLCGNLIWAVRFDGVRAAEQSELREQLYGMGIYEGAWVGRGEIADARERLLSGRKGDGWLTLNFYRGRLVVEKRYADPAPGVWAGEPCDLVAAEDGRIVAMDIRLGDIRCAPGQTVAKGQQLVAGKYLDRDGRAIVTPSEGSVTAQMVCRFAASRPLEAESLQPTGESKSGFALLGPWGALPLGRAPEPGAEDEVKVVRRPLEVCGFALPATLEETRVLGRHRRGVTLSEEQAAAAARMDCLRQLEEKLPGAVILQEEQSAVRQGDAVKVELTLTVQADIARRANAG